MPILDQYTRENECSPEPIGHERDDHDPQDDRYPDEDFSEWETPEPEPTWKENIINNIL